ncbi:TadE-like protein [Stieleria bergensis]|uniref:TadE-like protein n=1 Tax=Stieleria bergensis TaxID=2528025 RepID=A0A517SQE2_9BACT|nr:TadE-like protein [Planctomycetes bacterium SV_7m_r]
MFRRRQSLRNDQTHCVSRWPDRKGVATVELAFCVPLLLVFTMATLDLCSLFFLKETITLAAYEGARAGVARGRTDEDVINRIYQVLDERNVSYDAGSVALSSPGFTDAEQLQHVTVRVTLSTEGNLLVPWGRFTKDTLSADCTMRKEYRNPQVGDPNQGS